jgi:tetratricopeptide (TPR) repeat protein
MPRAALPLFLAHRMMRLLLVVMGVTVLCVSTAGAAPYMPGDDAQVLERARIARSDPLARELKTLRALLARNPSDLGVALRLSQRYIAATRETSDPRYLGYAEAALKLWWNQPQPPAEVLLMRATLRQSMHDFPHALADLDLALKADPRNAQSWLTRATILLVQSRYNEAAQSCSQLAALTSELVTAACLAQVGSVAGQASEAYGALTVVLARHPQVAGSERAWVETLLGEMAERLGKSEAADSHFKHALAADSDAYLKAAYADFLLDHGRGPEVISMLAGDTAADGLLLRLALAEQAIGDPRLAAHVLMLQQRFDAARLRGDTVHQREESRFALHLEHQEKRALTLAQANWEVQREPADARVLLEAAQTAGNIAAAAPVLAWMRNNRVEDVRLQPLALDLGRAANAQASASR